MVTVSPTPWTELEPTGRASLAVDGVEPRLHARPQSPEELAEVLRQASSSGLAVAPRGGGTQMTLGNHPSRLDLVLETGGLNRVVEYEPADLTITVEAGIAFSELQNLLRAQGQLLALDPPLAAGATIGGVIATNAAGPLRYAFGSARDLVIGTRVSNADGRLTRAGGRVVKNVAGYDLNKLHVGGLGTLGVLVELSFKLHPIPPQLATVAGRFARLEQARKLVLAVLHSALAPLGVELLGAAAADLAGLGRQPGVVMRLGGYPEAVKRQVTDLRGFVVEHGGEPSEEGEETWEAARELALRAPERSTLVRGAAPIAQSAALVDLLERALAPLDPVVWAHAGNGVAYAACRAPETVAGFHTAVAEARRETIALAGNGSLVVERCPPTAKDGMDVWGDVGDAARLMRALKTQLDPSGTLNPGRYVGGI